MKLITALRELACYFTAIEDMQAVRLTPAADRCYVGAVKIEGAEHAKTLVCDLKRSYFHEPIEEIKKPMGIPNVGLLAAIFKHPDYTAAEATIVKSKYGSPSIMIKGRNNAVTAVHTDISLQANFYEVPSFKFQDCWNIAFTPTNDTIDLLAHWTRFAAEHLGEDNVTILTHKDKAIGRFNCGPSCFKQFRLAVGVEGDLPPVAEYNARHLLALLKLHYIAESVRVRVAEKGALNVEVDSALAHYSFIIPGHAASSDYEDMLRAMQVNLAEQRMREFAEENP